MFSVGDALFLPLCQRYEELFNQVGVLSCSFKTISPEVQILAVDVSPLKDADFVNAGEGRSAARVKMPEPSSFDGVRNAKTLENFFWDMEQYFKVAKVPKGEQFSLVGMFLTNDAKLWWKTC